jgi:uncharacterized protein Yka (UPF0111/DUF47 family)
MVRLRWFLPETPDVLGLLVRQGELTVEGFDAFDRWAGGDASEARHVRRIEHEADDARRSVVEALRQAFTTPVEPEDLFELSERLDRTLNLAKDLVREAEVLAIAPDPPMAEMSRLSATGVRHLVTALPKLAHERDQATQAADAAIHQQRLIERVYRRAMSGLLESDDLREVTARREVYRRYARLGDSIEHVANRIWYTVVKSA